MLPANAIPSEIVLWQIPKLSEIGPQERQGLSEMGGWQGQGPSEIIRWQGQGPVKWACRKVKDPVK